MDIPIFVGFRTKEVRIRDKSVINVTLYPEPYPVLLEEEIMSVAEDHRGSKQRPGRPLGYASMKSAMDGSGGYYNAYQPDFNTEGYSTIHENGYKDVLKQPLSTFSIDVDRG